jgi:uncharacterized protein YydD (DUF2326 family)
MLHPEGSLPQQKNTPPLIITPDVKGQSIKSLYDKIKILKGEKKNTMDEILNLQNRLRELVNSESVDDEKEIESLYDKIQMLNSKKEKIESEISGLILYMSPLP